MATAEGTFEIASGSENPYLAIDDGPRLTHAGGVQRFGGDIEGDGTVDWLMCYLPGGSARFVGLQRVSGLLGGRAGSFVMEAVGEHDGARSKGTWQVIPGSGTGELQTITGEGGFIAPGGSTVSYRLDYRLE